MVLHESEDEYNQIGWYERALISQFSHLIIFQMEKN